MNYSQAEIAKAFEIVHAVTEPERQQYREAYKPIARQKMADWLMHAEGCDRRAAEYLAWAAEYPASHRLHKQFMAQSLDQRRKAAEARAQAKIEEGYAQ